MKKYKARSTDGETIHVYNDIEADTAEEALGLLLIDVGANFETAKFFEYKNQYQREPFLCFETDKDRFSVQEIVQWECDRKKS